jgi:Inositol hexakisphosphate
MSCLSTVVACSYIFIQILDRVNEGLAVAGDLIFNCQMGRGRTTTGMVLAGLVAIVLYGDHRMEGVNSPEMDNEMLPWVESGTATTFQGTTDDGISEEEAYLNGTPYDCGTHRDTDEPSCAISLIIHAV